jgi:hypothetical protein
VAVGLVYGFTALGDSPIYSTSITEVVAPAYRGAALALRSLAGYGAGAAVLRQGLLASSAFPGVFRPRNSWEIFPTSSNQDQYVDGGVMDNLPFASVVAFLDAASERTGLFVSTPTEILYSSTQNLRPITISQESTTATC